MSKAGFGGRGKKQVRSNKVVQQVRHSPKQVRAFAAQGYERVMFDKPVVKKTGGGVFDVHDPAGVRLQKVLALAGVASRRVCEDMIVAGRVVVGGQVVKELGVRVDPSKVAIYVDGMRIQTDTSLVYLAFNKPVGVVTTMFDPEGRPSLGQFLDKRMQRLVHVGRLDMATEGLLLLTNDGQLAHRLSHPGFEVGKTYLAEVLGNVRGEVGAVLRSGVQLEDGLVKVDKFRVVDSLPGHCLVEITLHSGRNRVVRRLMESLGYPVQRLVRTKVGPISLGDQRVGVVRTLGKQEVGSLLTMVGM